MSEYLQHHGVVGMKWGRRMAKITRPSVEKIQSIKKARVDLPELTKTYKEAKEKAKEAVGTRREQATYSAYRDAEKAWSSAHSLALTSTSMEKAERVVGSILGTAGALALSAIVLKK